MYNVPSADTKESGPSAVLTLAVPTAAAKTLAILLTLLSVDLEASFIRDCFSLPSLTSFCMSAVTTPSNSFM